MMQDEYLTDAITVAGSYHQARLFRPRTEGGYYMERPTSTVAFQPNLALYPPAGPWPVVESTTADPDILRRARDGADKLNMQFDLWLVTLHSSTLGQAHPELCVQNLVGDQYSFSLCPSQPRVRAYATGLVNDVCQQVQPHTLLLESASFMPSSHDTYPLRVLTHIGEAAHWLLGLCFCSSCLARAQASDIDALGALYDARSLLPALLDEGGDSLAEGAAPSPLGPILVGWSRLRAYAEMRMGVVTDLLKEMCQAAHDAGVRVEVMVNADVGDVNRAWSVGFDLRTLGEIADGAAVQVGRGGANGVRAEMSSLRALAPTLSASAALNAGFPATPDRDTLIASAAAAAETSVAAIRYQNWGLLSGERLGWVRAANAALLDRA
ncbi:MAG: hypothetical protein U0641_07705 [Anaerolineae bacterium]